MKNLTCAKCKGLVKLEEGGCILADTYGGADYEKALCGKCRVKPEDTPSRIVTSGKYFPRARSKNQIDWKATMQPVKRIDGKVVPNEKFYEYYGAKKADDPAFNKDPEFRDWLKKKYPNGSKRTSPSV